MTISLRSQVERLQQLNVTIRSQLEQAETFIPELNAQIDQLAAIGLVERTVILGQVIHHRGYDALTGPDDSGQVLMSALVIPGGIGTLFWDSEELYAFQRMPSERQSDVVLKFVTFDQCNSAVKSLLLPQVEMLMERFTQLIPPPQQM